MNDLPSLHDEADKLMFWQLSNELRRLRRRASHISTPTESSAGSAPVCTDAPGQANAGRDFGCSESGKVKP